MPKDENDKKDRDINYHHTLDAFAIALCSNGSMKTLNDSFKENENHFQTKAQKVKLKEGVPTTTDRVSIVEYLKSIVEKYETYQRLVCPRNKRKTNMKGFKDGNLKLYITQDPKDKSKEILAEMAKVAIDSSLLIKKVNGFDKFRSDDEVKQVIQSIRLRLNPQKQANIIKEIETYANRLLELRCGIEDLDKKIKEENKNLKTDQTDKKNKKNKEHNDGIKEKIIAPLQPQKKELSLEMQNLKCNFMTQKGKRQIVRKLNLYREKIEKSSADSIIFTQRKERSIERLSIYNFRAALENKEPFVIKENNNIFCVELYAHPKQNQVVGLKYFSTLANPHIKTKINEKYGDYFEDKKPMLTLYKNDIIKVFYTKEARAEYYIFNGGGDIAGGNNKVSVKKINRRTFTTTNKKGVVKVSKEGTITPNSTTVVSKVTIDFFGNIEEVKQNAKSTWL